MTLLVILCAVSGFIGFNVGYALAWAVDPRGIVVLCARLIVRLDDADKFMRECAAELHRGLR